jgi:apolipoprotein D and lipocalin family protein
MRRTVIAVALGLGMAFAAAGAQTVKAVPQLDMDRFSGTWYVIARYPLKSEKLCASDNLMLFALGDKARQYQVVKSCATKKSYSEVQNIDGKQSKSGDGELQSRHFVLFHRSHWVLALDPNYQWAIIGSPNHAALTILSRTPTLPPDRLGQLEAQAAAQGFATAKLVLLPQGAGS